MKVDNKPVTQVERAQVVENATKAPVRSDRVSVEQSRAVAQLAESAKRATHEDREARLKRLETAVRGGTFKPSPAKVAEEILAQAELDARLRALLSG